MFNSIKKKINDRMIYWYKCKNYVISHLLSEILLEIEKEKKIINCENCKHNEECAKIVVFRHGDSPLKYCSEWKNKNEK